MRKEMWIMIVWFWIMASKGWAIDPTVWHKGQLVLQNGTELKGELNFNWLAQVVQYRQGPVIKAYSAYQTAEFAYYDEQLEMLRKFVSINYSVKSGLLRPRILEEVVSGLLLVYREYRPGHDIIKFARPSVFDSDVESIKDISTFSYLVSFNEELIDINKFYRRIWPHLKVVYEQEYKEYNKTLGTGMLGLTRQIRLIYWYNNKVEKLVAPSGTEQDRVTAGQ